MGVNEQLANLQGELDALLKDVRVRDEAMVNLKKKMVTLRAEHDELEQYTRKNSVRLTGLNEATNENVYDIVMPVFNEEMGEKIDRIHRVGKPDPTRRRSILVKFATYRSKKRVVTNGRYLNPMNKAEIEIAPTIPATQATTQTGEQRQLHRGQTDVYT